MKRKFYPLVLLLFIFSVNLYSFDAEDMARKLNLSAGSKASIQWQRVFKSERKMKRYKIYSLSDEDKSILEEYLINHAIDSDKPTVAGEILDE